MFAKQILYCMPIQKLRDKKKCLQDVTESLQIWRVLYHSNTPQGDDSKWQLRESKLLFVWTAINTETRCMTTYRLMV